MRLAVHYIQNELHDYNDHTHTAHRNADIGLFQRRCVSGSLNVHHGSCTSKDGAFSFANTVPGVFENAKNADGFVEITPLKPSHRVRIHANICEDCRTIVFDY